MRTIFSVTVFLCLFAVIAAAQSKRNLTVDDYFAIKELAEPQVSPDGKWIAYTVKTLNLKDDKTNKDLWMISSSGGDPIQLTSHEKNDSYPRWSPDNKQLAFLSNRSKDKNQVFVMNRAGGEALQLTDIKQGVNSFEWAPDGKKLLLVLTDPDPDEPEEKDKDEKKTEKPIVITRLQFKRDTEGYLNDFRSHLHIFDIASKTTRQITSGATDDSNPRWSPDGKSILFVSNRTDNPDANRNSDLFIVSPEGGEPRKITTNPGTDDNPAWSPDGKWITYMTTVQPDLIWYDTSEVAVISATGGEPKVLTRELDRNGWYPSFSPDSKTVYFILEDRGTERVASVPAAGGTVNRNAVPENVVTDFEVMPDGSIVVLGSRVHQPEEVFLSKNGSEAKQLTFTNRTLLEQIQFSKVERIQFKSKDGTPVEGFVTFPPDFDRTKKYPLVLRIHGGPTSQYIEAFQFDWQLFAANGYVVVTVNPRGSTGYGEEFCKAIWADWGNKDFEDVMAGVDHVVAQGYVDPEKMGVGGWSYGGMLTDYTITKTTRFKAATSGASIANQFAGYGTDHYQYEWEKELGLPWEKPENWRKLSSFFDIGKVTTPTLFLCGQEDWNVPLINSEQLYQALRRRGVDTMLIIYPGQSHGITKPSYVQDRYERYLAWYAHYLQGKPEKVPPKKPKQQTAK